MNGCAVNDVSDRFNHTDNDIFVFLWDHLFSSFSGQA